jgi:plasmid maintenance system antidote protein VapI
MSQVNFARRAGFTQKHVSQVIRGRASISAIFAVATERTIGLPARVLARMQADFDVAQAEVGPAPELWQR